MAKTIKGLVVEFIILVCLNALDIGTDFAVYSEAQIARNRFKETLKTPNYISNSTKPYSFCANPEYDPHVALWDKRDFKDKVDNYGTIIDVYLFFLFVSGGVFTCYIIAYMWFLIKSSRNEDFLEDNRDKLIDIKFWFGAALSMVLNVPGASIAVALYAERWGARGLLCWECAQDPTCNDKRVFSERTSVVLACLACNFLGLVIISLWKGMTTFYRWSKTDKVDCWPVRGCVSLFVGCIFVVIMLAPSLGVFKYKFFMLPSQKGNVFADFTDSLFMIGMLGWIILAVVGCCFPLLQCIRIGPSKGQDK